MSEKTREKFEQWDRAQYEINPETYARKYEGRYYFDRAIQCRWECWQAARSIALEEAAKACESRVMGDNNREDGEAKRCASAIRGLAAGLGEGGMG